MHNQDLLTDFPDCLAQMFGKAQQNAFMLIEQDGYIVHVNDSFTKFFGYTDDDLKGKHTRLLFIKEDRMKNLPERELLNVKEQGFSIDNNYLLHKDGNAVWVSGESISMNWKGKIIILKILQNIDEQKRLENFLTASNDFVESILDHIRDIILVVNEKFDILKTNEAFFKQFNTDNKDPERMSFLSYLDERHYETLYSLLDDAVNGVSSSAEITCYAHKRHKQIYVVRAHHLERYQNGEKRILLVLQNVTADRMLEEQREDLVDFVAHEIRNPLSSVSLYTEVLGDIVKDVENGKAMDYLAKMKANIARVSSIISDLYEVTKAGSGHLKIQKASFQFSDLIAEAVSNFNMKNESHRLEQEGEANLSVFGDKHRIMQVLENYLDNAVKYAPESEKIVLRVSVSADELVVSVSDFGKGIPKSKLSLIFNKYYRASGKSNTEGTGLGLYLSKKIINEHGGEAWAESEKGRGASFYFSLPLSQVL